MASRKKRRPPRRLFRDRPAPPVSTAREQPAPPVPVEPEVVLDLDQVQFKMSDALGDLIKPYHELMPRTEAGLRALLFLGILGWNAAILPEDQRDEMTSDGLNTFFPDVTEGESRFLRYLIRVMAERKQQLYPTVTRLMMSFELIYTGGEQYHLNVASTLPLPPDFSL